jgi:hypothetical protein
MESYEDPKSENSQTAVKMLFGNGNMSETNYKKFKRLLEERKEIHPSLFVILTGDKDDRLDTDIAFDLKQSRSSGFLEGKWIELVKYMRSFISSIVSADTAYAEDLDWRLQQLDDGPQGAHLQKGQDMKNLAAGLQVVKALDMIENSRGKMSRTVIVNPELQFGQPATAIKVPRSEPLKLVTSEFVELLKTYLGYRLSDTRKGSRTGHGDDKIRYFNEKMNDINEILRRTSDRSGKKLYELLTQKGLIPVYFKDGDSRDDSVSDTKCLTSVSGGPFKQSIFSSGKHHCRTCGRCMNEDDKKTYNIDPENKNMFLNPVCIDCYNLFSGVPLPGPGGSAAEAAQ